MSSKRKTKKDLTDELTNIRQHLAELGIAETERKRVESILKASEVRYRRLFEAARDGILIIDADTGNIVDVNPFLEDLLDYSHEEFIGKKLWEIGAFKDIEKSKSAFKKLQDKEYIRYENLPLETKDGLKINVEFISNVYRVNDSKVIQCIIRDITERKLIEDELQERAIQLEAANKELESFSYSVSHDLRAPLRAIDGYVRLLLKRYGDKFNEDALSKFNIIRSSVHMMAKLIDDILTFSRLSRKHMSVSKMNIEALIGDVWKEMQVTNEDRNIKLTVNSIPHSYGDEALIKQVYSNLISNAVKFTKYRDTAIIEVGGYVDGNEDVYYVKDNGVGFDMKYCDKLFGVFQRLHSPEDFEGTGVGLATVQRIVNRHGGRVWAEGKEGKGATFYFSLPSSHTR